MGKQTKILLGLFIVALIIVLSWLLFFKPVKPVSGPAKNNIAQVDLKKLEEEYRVETKNILTDYSALLEANNLSIDKVEADKNKLLDLKVPVQFKDLHLNFVLAVSKMEDFLKNGKSEDRDASRRMISEIKTNYIWLN